MTLTAQSTISGAHLGLFITMLLAMGACLTGVGAVFAHELSPIRDDIAEIKIDIRELRVRPVPQALLDRIEDLYERNTSLLHRIEALEHK